MDTTNQCVGTLGAGHCPEADASAAGGRTADASPNPLLSHAGVPCVAELVLSHLFAWGAVPAGARAPAHDAPSARAPQLLQSVAHAYGALSRHRALPFLLLRVTF